MDQGLAPCEALLQQQSLLPASCYEASWEVGRLVLASRYRAGPEALKRCLFLTLLHLVQTSDIENLFATCSPVLSRLYRRLGFSVIVKDACESEGTSYSLIHGSVPNVLRALAVSDIEKEQAEHELELRASALVCH